MNKSLPHQTKAISLHKKVKCIQKALLETVEKQAMQAEQEIDALFDQETLDQKTLLILKRLFVHDKKSSNVEEDEKVERFIERVLEKLDTRSNDNDKYCIPLIFTEDGTLLWKENGKIYTYPLQSESKRYKLIQILINSHGYCASKSLQKLTGFASYRSLTNGVEAVNKLARKKLNLPDSEEHDFIISKKLDGYRINPLYPITKRIS